MIVSMAEKKKLFAIRKYFKEEKKRKRWKNIGRIKKSLQDTFH